MYGWQGLYNQDQNDELVSEPVEMSDWEWTTLNMTTTHVTDSQLTVREIVRGCYETFDLTFNGDGKLLDVECTSSPHHGADKVLDIRTKIEKRL